MRGNDEQRTDFKARKQGLKPNLVPKPDHFLSFRSRHQSLRIFIRPAFKLSQCQNHNSVFIFFLRKTSPAYNPNRYQEIKLYENKKSVLPKPYPSYDQRLSENKNNPPPGLKIKHQTEITKELKNQYFIIVFTHNIS